MLSTHYYILKGYCVTIRMLQDFFNDHYPVILGFLEETKLIADTDDLDHKNKF